MHDLGVSAYRFSVSWPRVMPGGHDGLNELWLAFYDRLIDALIATDIEPWLCLYHWDLPQALEDLGGWATRDCVQWFADYATLIARRYGDRVTRYATFNEPSVFTLFGYCLGGSAPGISDHATLLRVIHHVNLAHGAAVDRSAPRCAARQSAQFTIASLAARPAATLGMGWPRKHSMRIGMARFLIRNCSAAIRHCLPMRSPPISSPMTLP